MARANRDTEYSPPWPHEWGKPGGLMLSVGVMAFGAFGVVSGITGLFRVAAGQFDASSLILLASAPFLIGLAGATWLLRLGVRRRSAAAVHNTRDADSNGPGTVIPNSRGVWLMMTTALGSMLATFGLMGGISWIFLLSGTETSPRMLFQALISTGFACAVLWFFWNVRKGNLTQGSLILSPGGITHKAWGPTRTLPWNSIRHVFPSPGDAPNIAVGFDPSQVTVPLRRKDSILTMSGSLLSVDPALAYRAVEFYLENPELREELGARSGVDRIKRAEFSRATK